MNARIDRGTNHTSTAELPIISPMRTLSAALRPFTDHLAEETSGPEDQEEDQHREREDVLVLRAERAAGEQRQVGRGERLEQAEDEPADHRAGNVSDAAEHGGGEGLQSRNESRVRIDETVLHAEEHAGGAAHR